LVPAVVLMILNVSLYICFSPTSTADFDIDDDCSAGFEQDMAELPVPLAGTAVELPTINFVWADKSGKKVSQGTLLLSGLENDDIEVDGIEGCVNSNGTGTALTMDLSHSFMFYPDLYNHAHKYDAGHVKMMAFREAVEKAKGDSEHNKLKFVHKETTLGTKVLKDLSHGGLRVFKLGAKKNPQLIASMDMEGVKSGFSSPDPKTTHVDHSVVLPSSS
jgi:hypothetical protein